MFNPKVSIIIPVYNGANFLHEAIKSALAQTYANKEIIVINDGSTDGGATEAIALQYGDKIRYFSKENGGVSSALNYGIRQMTGEWFSWLSHDDLYTPKKIEHSIRMLDSYTGDRNKLLVYCDGYLIKADKTIIKKFKKMYDPGKIYSGLDAAKIMVRTGTLCGCSLLIPKNAFSVVGLFDETLRYSQDTLMWYSLFFNGFKICLSPEKDVLSRVHEGQVTHSRKDLFVRDSLFIAQQLAPLLARECDTDETYYLYIKKLTRLFCDETIDYLLDYSDRYHVLSARRRKELLIQRRIGKIIGKSKTAIRQIIVH